MTSRPGRGVLSVAARSGSWLLRAVVLPVLVGGCQASQQGRRSGIRNANVTNMQGYLEFVTRQRDQQQRSKVGSGDTDSTEAIFEENVGIEMDGYVYHPNLFDFTLGALVGLRQHDYEDTFGGRTRKSSDDGDVLEFDFEGEIVKRKNYPGSVFARRYRSIDPRPFLPSMETTTTNYGLTWQYVSDKMPINLQFSHTDVLLQPMGGDEPDGQQTNTLFRGEIAYRFNDHNVASLIYDKQLVKERPFALDFDSDEFTLKHRLDFGDSRQYRLDSELNHFTQRGTFSIERFRWREILRLQHDDRWRSWYRFELLNRRQGSLSGVPPINENSIAANATLEHRLYDSLITQLLGFVHVQKFETGLRIQRYGGQLSVDYRKKNPWGALIGNYRIRMQTEDRTGGDFDVEVLDEAQVFTDPEPIVLRNTNVRLGSLFITAEDRTTSYRQGQDYTVTTQADRVELRRVATGRIPDGARVLIDYVFHIAGSFLLDTFMQDLGVRQNFDNGWSPYYRLRWQKQTITPRDATGAVPEDITGQTFGVEFARKSLRLVAEYEEYDSTVNPFTAARLSADYTRRFQSGATGVLKGRWTRVDHDEPFRRTTLLTVEGRYRHPISDRFIVEAVVLFRRENDSLSGDDEGLDVDLSLEWAMRETEVKVTYDYGRFDDDFAENENSTLWVQVRRRF